MRNGYRSGLWDVLVKFYFTLGLLSAGDMSLSAQPAGGEPAIAQHYAAQERIPNTVVDFVFDDKGLLWIAPENENIRLFDGTNVKILEAPFAKGVPQFEFSRILKDRAGRLCFVSRYQEFLFRLTDAGQLLEDSVSRAHRGHIYNGGDYFFDWDAFIKRAVDEREKNSREALRKRLAENKTFAAFNDSSFVFKESDSFLVYGHGRVNLIATAGVRLANLFLLRDELYLLGPDGFGLVDDRSGVKRPVVVTGDLLADSLYRAGPGRVSPQIFQSAHPHVLYGSRLYRIEYGDGGRLSTVYVGDVGFIRHAITKVEFEPREGITAIGTMGEGLYILRANPFYSRRFDEAFLAIKRKQIFFPLTVVGRDTFFTGWSEFTGQGSYRLFDLSHEGPRTLFTDKAGNVWEGGKSRIVRYDQNRTKQAEMMIPSPDGKVVDFCESDAGRLFCLTERSMLEYEGGVFTDKRPVIDKPAGDIRFEQMRYIGNGISWIAANKGLYQYDEHANRMTRVEGVPDVFTLNVTKLSGGSILITCYPEAFYYLYYKNRFFKIPVETDLPLKETSSVIEDGKGRIWFATASGLFVTSEKEIESWCDGGTNAIYYYKYGRNEGLPDLEFNGGLNPSNGISGDGYLVFNSMGGVMMFHQDSVREQFPGGILQLALRGKTGEEYTAGDSIHLAHDNDGMLVQVRVPYFGSRENLRIEYAMSPQTGSWQEVDPQGRINFSHLAHGSYYLRVRVRNGLRPGDYLTRQVAVVVPYLFYETAIFRIVAAVLLLLIGVGVTVAIVRLRREVNRKNIRLHEQNVRLQSALGHLQENMALKEKLISLILHDLKTPLYFQSLLFNKIVEADYFRNEEGRELFLDLKNSSAAILQFTKEFLTWYSSQREGFQVRKTRFDHAVVVDDLFSVYSDIAARKNLELQYSSEGVGELFTDRNILEIIIRNLLDNAIKYTEQGKVSVVFERRGENDAIIVSDTGGGMKAEKIRELEEDAVSSLTFGYRFIYTMAEKIGATIQIASEPGKGSCVTILFATAAGG